jgi:SAM-dependent methyltransferase
MLRAKVALQQILKTQIDSPESRFSRCRWSESLDDPIEFYKDCVRFFYLGLPPPIRKHRGFFQLSRRGFGEDAFHVMWYFLCREFRPSTFLEIGVYRGQVLSLISLLSRQLGFHCDVTGVSPFLPAGDSVSTYRAGVDYMEDTVSNFRAFGLPPPQLLRAFSTDADARNLILSHSWDVIYIDGNHDYEVVQQDWEICSRIIKPGGIIVLDDSSLGTDYRPPVFATAGHPGPSRLAEEVDPTIFLEILRVGHNRVFQKKSLAC